MKSVIIALKEKQSLMSGNGVDDAPIKQAEAELGLFFSDEYKEYLRTFKIAAYDGHELTGLVESKRVGVVPATISEWNINPNSSKKMYVIEKTGVDGVVIWQNEVGEIFYTHMNGLPVPCCKSLEEYIRKY